MSIYLHSNDDEVARFQHENVSFYLNKKFGIISCGYCGAMQRPQYIWRHLKDKHSRSDRISRSKLRKYLESVLRTHLNDNWENKFSQLSLKINNISAPLKPIQGISLYSGGLKCNYVGCFYCCLKLRSMQEHQRSLHMISSTKRASVEDIAVYCTVQMWYGGKYFPVSAEHLSSSRKIDPKHYLIENRVSGVTNRPQDIPSFECFARWDRVIPPDSYSLLLPLTNGRHPEFSTEQNQHLKSLFMNWFTSLDSDIESVPRFIKSYIMKESNRLTEFKLLQTEESKKKYATKLCKMFIFISQLVITTGDARLNGESELSRWHIRDSNLYGLCERILLNAGQQIPATESGDVITEFLFYTLCRKLEYKALEDNDFIFQFLVLSTLNKDGSRYQSSSITSLIAVLQYGMRASFLRRSLKCSEATVEEIKNECNERLHTDNHNIASLLNGNMGYITKNAVFKGYIKYQFTDSSKRNVQILGGVVIGVDDISKAVSVAMAKLQSSIDNILKDYNGRKQFHLLKIKEDPQSLKNNYNFASDHRNKMDQEYLKLLHYYETIGMDILNENSSVSKSFMTTCKNILRIIFFLLHVSAGVPYRASTWGTTRLRNSTRAQRSIRILLENELCFYHFYDKTRSSRGFEVLRAKFPDPKLSNYIIIYLVLIRPIEAIIADKLYGNLDGSVLTLWKDFLFVDGTEQWKNERFRNSFMTQFQEYTNLSITFQDYRHIAQALCNSVLVQQTNSQEEYFYNLQFGHSVATGSMYGLTIDDNILIATNYLKNMRTCCRKWQHIIGLIEEDPLVDSIISPLQNVIQINKKVIHEHRHSLAIVQSTMKDIIIKRTLANVDTMMKLPKIITEIENMVPNRFGYDKAFRSDDQMRMFQTVYASKNDVIVVLPTGEGKSVIYRYLPLVEDTITIVIIPLIALLHDQEKKCQKFGIPFNVYHENMTKEDIEKTKLLFVQLEKVGPQFYDVLCTLEALEAISRIVIDEAHLSIFQSSFRSSFEKLRILASLQVQKVLMTATLPPKYENEFKKFMWCNEAPVIRNGSTPSNLVLSVLKIPSENSVCDTIMSMIEFKNPKERCIIYCLTKHTVEFIGTQLCNRGVECGMYNADLDDNERKKVLYSFQSSENIVRVVVTTSAFSCGVDYPFVSRIIVVGAAYSLAELAQMAGRGGRAQTLQCHVVLLQWSNFSSTENFDIEIDMVNYVNNTTICRRLLLDMYLQGVGNICNKSRNQALCCICQKWDSRMADAVIEYDCDITDEALQAVDLSWYQRPSQGYEWINTQFLEMNQIFRFVCGLCKLAGKNASHSLNLCVEFNGNHCFNCIRSGCNRKACEFRRIKSSMQGSCIRCCMEIKMHDNDSYGTHCTLQQNDFNWVFTLGCYLYKPEACHDIFSIMRVPMPNNFKEFLIWATSNVVSGGPRNVLAFIAHYIRNQNRVNEYFNN